MESVVSHRLRFSFGAFLGQALPMIVSRAGLAAMQIADGIMVSRYDARSFAWLSLADGTLGRLLDIFIAFIIGGLSLAPRHYAQGDFHGARAIWIRSIPSAFVLGAIGIVLGYAGTLLLELSGQKADLALHAGPVMMILGAGYPAALLAIAAAVYLEGVNRPVLVAVAVVFANLLNIAMNWVFIGGHLGMPAMGALGSALSTTLVRCGLAVVLVTAAFFAHRNKRNAIVDVDHQAERDASRRAQWKLGAGAAGTVGIMVALGSSLTVFAGWLGVLPLASFSAAWNLTAPIALVALGLSDAAGVFVAAEAGRIGDRSAAQIAWACLRLSSGLIALISILLALFANSTARIYTNDVTMRSAMAGLIPLVALIITADSIGFVMAASLRAVREVAWPVGIEIGAMMLLVPLAAWLAFSRSLGVRGLFVAMLTAGTVRAVLLVVRFAWRTRVADGTPQVVVRLET